MNDGKTKDDVNDGAASPTLVIVEGGYFLSAFTIIMTVPKPIIALVIMLAQWYRSKMRMTELAAYK